MDDMLKTTGADSVLLAEAEDADGASRPVLLIAALSPSTGGVMWVPRPYDASVDKSVLLHQLRLWCVVILRMVSDPPSSVHGVGPSLICARCWSLPHLCMVLDPPSSVHGARVHMLVAILAPFMPHACTSSCPQEGERGLTTSLSHSH